MKKILIFFFVLVIIIGCGKKKYLAPNNYSENDADVNISTINIAIDSTCLQTYFLFSVYDNKSEEFVYNYNKANHSIDIFNLTTNAFFEKIQLDKSGPEGIGELLGLYVHNKDSIFMYSRGLLALKNAKGLFINKINLLNLGPYEQFGEVGFNVHLKMKYNPVHATLLFYSFYSEELRKQNPIITSLNLKTGQLDQLPIFNSDFFEDNDGEVGFLSYLNMSSSKADTLLVYNFEYESNIYAYNLNSKNIDIYGAKSEYSPGLINLVSTKNPDQWERHAIENPHYLHVLFDPYENLYYRFHWGGVPYKASNNQFNSFIDKPLYLMVLNDKFEILKEIELPKNRYGIHSWAVTRNGILMSNSHPMNEDIDENHLTFDLVRISINEN